MAPEPIQSHSDNQQTWDTLNLPNDNDTDNRHLVLSLDNDREHIQETGYLPLAQEQSDSDSIVDDDDDDDDNDDDEDDEEEEENVDNQHQWISSTTSEIPPSTSLQSLQVHSSSSRSRIHLDTDKINQVKSMMANFKLPTDTYPPWASTVSEDQWKRQLIDRIKHNNNL